MSIDPKKFGLSNSLIDAVNEALHPNQKKLDVAEPKGKLDAKDFKKLRGEGSKPTVTNFSHERKVQKEEALDEKAVSQAQQKAAGAALATQRGEYAGGKKGGAVNRMALMKASELRKIAATKRTGLPMRKEETELDEADSYSIKNTKTDNTYHISKYPITSNHSIYKKIKAKDPKAQIHKNGQPVKEEVEELDELSKKTLYSYGHKADKQIVRTNVMGVAKRTGGIGMKNAVLKLKNRKAGSELAFKKAQKAQEEVEVTEADDAIAKQIATKKDAMQKQIRQKIAQKQMSVLQQKAQKKIQTIKAGTEKCSCGTTNESKMKCEVHGGNMNGAKGGKEAIVINPPLREASKTKY